MIGLLRLLLTVLLVGVQFAATFLLPVVIILMLSDTDQLRDTPYIVVNVLVVLFFVSLYLMISMLVQPAVMIFKHRKDGVDSKKNPTLYNEFEAVKESFGYRNVSLYYLKNGEKNAYAVSGIFWNYIFMCDGLDEQLVHYYRNDSDKYRLALRGVLAHEMSHIRNADSMPAYFVNSSAFILDTLHKMFILFLNFGLRIMSLIPIIGTISAIVIGLIVTAITTYVGFILQGVVFPVHDFLSRFLGRKAEYRCDLDSAVVCRDGMMLALSTFDDYGYDSVYSTHPSISDRLENLRNTDVVTRGLSPRFNIEKFVYHSYLLMSLALLCFIIYNAGH